MDDLWQQFHRLPKTIRDAVATPEALAAVERLEQANPNVDLANFVMRVMTKEFSIADLPKKLAAEAKLDEATSIRVVNQLKNEVFFQVADYLGFNLATSSPTPADSPRPVPAPPVNLPVTPAAQPAAAPASVSRLATRSSMPMVASSPPPKPPVSLPIVPLPTPAKPVGAVAPTQEYSEEETKEIAQQSAHVRTLQGMAADFDEIAKNILEQLHLAWPDELLTKRAEAIAKTRLKDIRNSVMTEEMLVREPKIGGLGLDPDLAKQLVARLEAEAKALKERGMVRTPAPIQPPPPSVPPPLAPAKPVSQPPLVKFIPPSGLPPAPSPLPSVTEAPRLSRPIKRPADIPAPVITRPIAPPLAPVVQRARQVDRPAMTDITRPVNKALGPAEEMKSLTLTEWRRLGQGAAESSRHLIEKFRHLERESFSLWTSAIAGWRQSEVYLLYLEMGRQSLDQGMSIQDVITTRAKNGQAYLSEHEFFAVADLNRQLQMY